MYQHVDVKGCLNQEWQYLPIERYDILLIPFLLHGFSDDTFLVIFLIVFPKVVQYPGIDDQLSNEQNLSKQVEDKSQSLEVRSVKLVILTGVLMKDIDFGCSLIHAELAEESLFPSKVWVNQSTQGYHDKRNCQFCQENVVGNFLGVQLSLEKVVETDETVGYHANAWSDHHPLVCQIHSPVNLTAHTTYVFMERLLRCDG